MNTNIVRSLVAGILSAFTVTGCVADPSSGTEIDSQDADSAEDEESAEDVDTAEDALTTALTRPSNARLRVVSWNVMRGGVFPRSDPLWKVINTAGKWDEKRTMYAGAVFKSMNADVWLLQETAYEGLPGEISVGDVNSKIEKYIEQVTGKGWTVKCNGKDLCVMVRDTLQITESCLGSARTNGYLLDLPGTDASLVIGNVHYKNVAQANETAQMMTSSTATAKLVAGDFNDEPDGDRHDAIDAVPTLDAVALSQLADPGAVHLTSGLQASAKLGKLTHTKGFTSFVENSGGHALVSKESGGHIDHVFFGSSSFSIRRSFILNTLLLSKETLNKHKLHPLAASITPEKHASYFASFLSSGKISSMPSGAPPVDHDHLPLVVDLDFPSSVSGSAPDLVCP